MTQNEKTMISLRRYNVFRAQKSLGVFVLNYQTVKDFYFVTKKMLSLNWYAPLSNKYQIFPQTEIELTQASCNQSLHSKNKIIQIVCFPMEIYIIQLLRSLNSIGDNAIEYSDKGYCIRSICHWCKFQICQS